MLKVSWKILSRRRDPGQNFPHGQCSRFDPTEFAECGSGHACTRNLGLIGFHAVHKTASRPQWIWTSFEHVKNVPDKDEVATKKFDGPYNFFSVNCRDHVL